MPLRSDSFLRVRVGVMFVYQINLFYDPDGVVENAARRARESIICEVIDLLDMLD